MKPLLSILVGTRNRVPYCLNVIETILKFEYQNFELIIQDNSDTLFLGDYIRKNLSDGRLKYFYTPPPLSSIDNFNRVIELAQGEYLCLIGDDDGINPEIFKIIEWAYENDVAAILPELNVIYRWPDACPLLKGYENDNGELSIHKVTLDINYYNTSTGINNLLKYGGQNYLGLHLPKLYHGIVKKIYLDLIKEKTGYYVGGLSPDIYFSVALSMFIKNVIQIDYPIMMPGVCMAPILDHMRKFDQLEDAPHFRDRGNYKWSELVPRFYCAENIWADSALASLNDMNENQAVKKFNVPYLTICLLKKYKNQSEAILNNYYQYRNSSNIIINRFYKESLFFIKIKISSRELLQKGFVKICKILKRKFFVEHSAVYKHYSFKNIENIGRATEMLNSFLFNHSLSIEMVIDKLNRNTNKYKAD